MRRRDPEQMRLHREQEREGYHRRKRLKGRPTGAAWAIAHPPETHRGGRRDLSVHKIALKHGAAVGGSVSPEYRAWRQAKNRTLNPAYPKFHRYGGRGIAMAAGWASDFAAFLRHVGPRPGPGYSLDRIDNDGDYAPGNVRWATAEEQARNRGATR